MHTKKSPASRPGVSNIKEFRATKDTTNTPDIPRRPCAGCGYMFAPARTSHAYCRKCHSGGMAQRYIAAAARLYREVQS